MTTAGDGQAEPGRAAEAPPADPRALEQEIERTREELGETVAALMAKADVKARAAEKGRALSNRLTGKAGHARERLASQAGHARELVASQAGQARQLSGRARPDGQHPTPAGTLLGAGSGRGSQPGQQAAGRASKTAAPARRAAGVIRQYPVPAAVAAAVLLLAAAAVARGRRR